MPLIEPIHFLADDLAYDNFDREQGGICVEDLVNLNLFNI